MASRDYVLLFPHEHEDPLSAVHDLSVRSKTQPHLRDFLAAASAVVHNLCATLDVLERTKIGEFEDLVDLCERHVLHHRSSVVVEFVLLITIQVGQLVV